MKRILELISILIFVNFLVSCSSAQSYSRSEINIAKNRGDVVVSPEGPLDGGDFGPHTPGTKTSGLQEAFDHAKLAGRDLYITGGSWTHGKNRPAVYDLHETLRIPWMQDFRCNSGHHVIAYRGKTGDAIVIDSQMSCYYRFGLIVSNSKAGAVVAIRPTTAGPDKFKVFTSTELHINALVGGGGAWPSGEAYGSELNHEHQWRGTGLLMECSEGPIDGNKINVVEIVGCNKGIFLKENCTNNWIESQFIHLCNTHIQVGTPDTRTVSNNRVDAFMNSQGIKEAVGARIFGQYNIMTLSCGQMSPGGDVVFEASARDNLVTANMIPNGITNRAEVPTNRMITSYSVGYSIDTPQFPESGVQIMNQNPYPVSVEIVSPGAVSSWTLADAVTSSQAFEGQLFIGQSITLDPGDKIMFVYSEKPTWRWRALR